MKKQLKSDDTVIGYLMNMWWFDVKEVQQRLNDLIFTLASFGKPVAILDEIGNYAPFPQLTSYKNVKIFRIAGKLAGAAVARRLLSLGHQRVIFISSVHRHEWSVRRLEGLEEQYAKAGLEGQVVPIVMEEFKYINILALALSGISREKLREILIINRTEDQVNDMLHRLDEILVTGIFQFIDDERLRAVISNFRGLEMIPIDKIQPDLYARCRDSILEKIESIILDLYLSKLFKQAHQARDCTAWVAANDNMALRSIRFLKEKGVAIPDEISIIGFDNLPQLAFENRLTSYDFNVGGIIHRMLWFILRPDRVQGEMNKLIVEVEGLLIERETTGKVKQAGRK
jgi:DNA-binding LacI/PurR family transcriptional regulator